MTRRHKVSVTHGMDRPLTQARIEGLLGGVILLIIAPEYTYFRQHGTVWVE